MKFPTRLQSTDFVLVLVLVPRPYKILIYEDKDDKNQIRSHAYALRLFLFSAFRIPHSNFRIPDTFFHFLNFRHHRIQRLVVGGAEPCGFSHFDEGQVA